jgi:hypothetical protein
MVQASPRGRWLRPYRSRRYSQAYRLSNCRFNSALLLKTVTRIMSLIPADFDAGNLVVWTIIRLDTAG